MSDLAQIAVSGLKPVFQPIETNQVAAERGKNGAAPAPRRPRIPQGQPRGATRPRMQGTPYRLKPGQGRPYPRASVQRSPHFSMDNPIHELMAIEVPMSGQAQIRTSYARLKKILDYVNKRDRPNMSPQQKLALVYEGMEALGVTFQEGRGRGLTFNSSMTQKNLDCDTSSFVVLAIAHEKNWPVHLVQVPDHTFVRWDDGQGVRFNMDFKEIHSDTYYARRNHVSPVSVSAGTYMTNRDLNDVLAHFLTLRGLAYMHRDKLDEAAKDFSWAVQLDPASAWAFHNRGIIQAKKTRRQEAYLDMVRSVQMDPINATMQLNLALLTAQMGKHQQSVATYKRAIELGARRVKAYAGLGAGLLRLGRRDEALQAFRKAMDMNRHSPLPYILRGHAEFDLGHYDKAHQQYKKALQLLPGDQEILAFIARAEHAKRARN